MAMPPRRSAGHDESDLHVASAETAIVGAGMAGLALARALAGNGRRVVVFDKGRGVGGRMSTRRDGPHAFDHGAQYFTARGPRFLEQVQGWCDAGVAAEWRARFVALDGGRVGADPRPGPRFVGVPGMNEVLRELGRGLDVRFDLRVSALVRHEARWRLRSAEGDELGAFARVVVAVPAPQALPLLAQAPALVRRVAAAEFAPCIAMLLAFERPLEVPFDAAFVAHPPLRWLARDSSKPGRAPGERWVVHAGPEFSTQHLEDDPRALLPELFEAFGAAIGLELPPPLSIDAHRWRHALPTRALSDGPAWDAGLGLGYCGDWCRDARVEAAHESGLELARLIDASG